MDAISIEPVSADQFMTWVVGREQRFELVDGQIVMMAGTGRRHDRIVVNLTAALHPQIRNGPCQTFTGDTFIAVSPTTRRMPDLGVDCGQPADESMVADRPVLLVEMLSPTTSGFDTTVKLAEYQALGSVEYVLLLDTETPSVHLYARDPEARWTDTLIRNPDSAIKLPKLDVELPLAEIYAGLEFRPRPRLVEE